MGDYLPVATDFMEGSEMRSKFTNFLRHLMAPKRKEATDRESEKAVDYKGYTVRPTPRAGWDRCGARRV